MAVGDVPLTPIIDTVTGSVTEIGRIFLRTLTAAVGALAPIDAPYWTSKATSVLSAEVNLGALASGYLKIATAVGIATPSTVATIPQADITGLAASLAGYQPIAPRVTAVASSATPTPNADTTDVYSLTAQAAAAAFANPTGTPANAQELRIRIKDNGAARALTWGTALHARRRRAAGDDGPLQDRHAQLCV